MSDKFFEFLGWVLRVLVLVVYTHIFMSGLGLFALSVYVKIIGKSQEFHALLGIVPPIFIAIGLCGIVSWLKEYCRK